MQKVILLSLAFIAFTSFATAQLKAKPSCGEFSVDILNGTVDNAKPDFVLEQIKAKFPCFTSEDQEATGKCGSALFYTDKDIKFYVKRQYIEIGPAFKGKLSIPVMGAARGSLFKYFGNPKVKDTAGMHFKPNTARWYFIITAQAKLTSFSSAQKQQTN